MAATSRVETCSAGAPITATGGERGTIRLHGAHLAGQLSLRGATLANAVGLLVDLQAAHADAVFLSADIVCPSHGQVSPECTASN
jgi:hypothetical protein